MAGQDMVLALEETIDLGLTSIDTRQIDIK